MNSGDGKPETLIELAIPRRRKRMFSSSMTWRRKTSVAHLNKDRISTMVEAFAKKSANTLCSRCFFFCSLKRDRDATFISIVNEQTTLKVLGEHAEIKRKCVGGRSH